MNQDWHRADHTEQEKCLSVLLTQQSSDMAAWGTAAKRLQAGTAACSSAPSASLIPHPHDPEPHYSDTELLRAAALRMYLQKQVACGVRGGVHQTFGLFSSGGALCSFQFPLGKELRRSIQGGGETEQSRSSPCLTMTDSQRNNSAINLFLFSGFAFFFFFFFHLFLKYV